MHIDTSSIAQDQTQGKKINSRNMYKIRMKCGTYSTDIADLGRKMSL